MRSSHGTWRWLSGALFLLACGGRLEQSGAASGGAGATAQGGAGATAQGGAGATDTTTSSVAGAPISRGASGSSATLPTPECGQYEPQSVPSPVTFVFHSDQPIWIRQSCQLEYQLTYACTGEPVPFVSTVSCTPSCSDAAGFCTECGACLSAALPVSPDQVPQTNWDGKVYGFEMRPGSGCQCADDRPAPAGRYLINIMTYASEDDALRGQNGIAAVGSFALPPMPGGIVDVNLGRPGI